MNSQLVAKLASQGVSFTRGVKPLLIEDAWNNDFELAMDAQPTLITVANSGVPAWMTNLMDPEVIRVILTPMNAVDIIGEVKKGDWTTLSTQFPVVEATGTVSSYGDYNNNGTSGANVNWPSRQSYYYQTISTYGERELDMYGTAQISYKNEVDMAGALVLSKFQNQSYFFGVAGLQNYGLLNDPGLIAPIVPTTKTAGGTQWVLATAEEIYADVLKLFVQTQSQMGSNIKVNEVLTLAMSPGREALLQKTNSFGISVIDLLAKNFPNLTIKTAPEYTTIGGELMQMIVDKFQGSKTAYAAFTEKMRAHQVIPDLSSFKQKKSAGTWGAIIRRPIGIGQMLGI